MNNHVHSVSFVCVWPLGLAAKLNFNISKVVYCSKGEQDYPVVKWSYDPHSYECNFSNCIEKPEKFRTSTGFEPMTSRCQCDAVTHWPMKPLMLGVGQLSISHNQWIALKTHSDWLLKLRISFAIHLRATCTGFAPKTVVIVAGIKELKSPFCATIHINVRWLVYLPSCKVALSDSMCAVIGWFSGPYSTVRPANLKFLIKHSLPSFSCHLCYVNL